MENNGIRIVLAFLLGMLVLVLSIHNSGMSWKKAWSGPDRLPASNFSK